MARPFKRVMAGSSVLRARTSPLPKPVEHYTNLLLRTTFYCNCTCHFYIYIYCTCATRAAWHYLRTESPCDLNLPAAGPLSGGVGSEGNGAAELAPDVVFPQYIRAGTAVPNCKLL